MMELVLMFLLKMKEECDEISSMLNELNKIVMDFYNEDFEDIKVTDNDTFYIIGKIFVK